MDPAKFGCTGTVFAKSETMRLDREKKLFSKITGTIFILFCNFCSASVVYRYPSTSLLVPVQVKNLVVDKIFYVEVFFKLVFFFFFNS